MADKKMEFLPYGRQDICEADIEAVTEVLRGDYLTTGPKVAAFEVALCQALGSSFASVCANGTAGLHMAALAAGIGPGDCAIVPTVTFLATANAVRLVGGEVIFSDVDPETGLMMPEHLEEALSRVPDGRLKAIFTVHLNGQTGDPEGVQEIGRRMGVPVIEDACHAVGTRYRDREGSWHRVGACSHSDMAVYSFHPVKSLTTGEGGAVLTNDPVLLDRLNLARNHGMTRDPGDFQSTDLAFDTEASPNPWYYEMHAPGLNYRLNDIQCALGLSQLSRMEEFVGRRRALARQYDQQLVPLHECLLPVGRVPESDPAWHLYVVRINFDMLGKSRARVMEELKELGIGSQVHYLPVHLQPYYRQLNHNLVLSGSEEYYRQILSIPLFTTMTDDDVTRVCNGLRKISG